MCSLIRLEGWWPQMLPTAVRGAAPQCFQSCRPKRFPKPEKRLSQSGSASNLFPKASFQSDSRKLLPKLPCKKAPQTPPSPKTDVLRCSTKMCPQLSSKAVARKLRFCKRVYQKMSPKPFCKAATDGPRIATPGPENCFQKRLPKAAS